MIEENEARADLSPCEKCHSLITRVSEDHFDTIEQAIKALHPNASHAARTRLRAVAYVVDALDGVPMAPKTQSQRALLRLNAALRPDFTDLIVTALREQGDKSPVAQWAVLDNILTEAETAPRDPAPYIDPRPDRPRRIQRPVPA
jgi:ParB family chromosome partitioning protein